MPKGFLGAPQGLFDSICPFSNRMCPNSNRKKYSQLSTIVSSSGWLCFQKLIFIH